MSGLDEAAVKSMATEICLHRGETPWMVDSGGVERWEQYKPLATAVLKHAAKLATAVGSEPVARVNELPGCNLISWFGVVPPVGTLLYAAPDREKIIADLTLATDLLAERVYGTAARSPGHNARLVIERALAALKAQP